MAASSSDYFMKVGYSTATTLSSPGYTTGATSINVGSTSNIPTDTGVYIMIDETETVDGEEVRVAGTYNVFRGVVSSGTQVSSLVYEGGDANRDYSAGAGTRVYITVSKFQMNRLIDGILEEHEQDGGHNMTSPKITTSINDSNDNEIIKLTATSSAVNELTVANAATGNAPSVAATGTDTNIDLNLVSKGTGEIQFNGVDVSGAWQDWTPSYSNITVGNGTVTAKYKQIGKTVHFDYQITCGSTTSIGSGATVSLPVTAASRYGTSNMGTIIGTASFFDIDGAFNAGRVRVLASTTVMGAIWDSGSGSSQTTTPPVTEASGDTYTLSGTYEAA